MSSPYCVRKPLSRGFAMIEILIILGVIVVMMGSIAEPQISNDRAERIVKVRSELATIATALGTHYAENGTFPATLTDTTFLSGALGATSADDVLGDEWGGAVYRRTLVSSSPDVIAVYSVGQDGVDAGYASEPLVVIVQGRTVADPLVRAQLGRCVAVIKNLRASGDPGAGFATLPTAIDAGQVRDRYGTALRRENGGLTVRSAGADRVFGTADDLTETEP